MIGTFWRPKKLISVVAACGMALAFAAGNSLAVTDQGPATMVLKTAKAKKPATFPHALHQKTLTCKSCHHSKDDAGKQQPLIEGQTKEKCATCHNKSMTNKKLNSFKKAAHARCKSCHKIMKKAGQKTGPTKCTGCHIKGLR